MSYSDRPLADMVVHRLLTDRAASSPDLPFIHFGDATVSYGGMDLRARRAADALARSGVAHGDMVAVMMRNSVDYVSVYFGLAYLGATVVLVNDSFHGYMLEYVLNDSGCSLVIADGAALGALVEAEPALAHLNTVLLVGDRGGARHADGLGIVDFSELVAEGGEREPDQTVAYTDVHCVVYSSGTTGPSKGIMISNGHAVAKAFEVIEICGFGPDDILYSPLPLFYSMGLLRGVLSVALTGASIVLRERFSVSAYWPEVHATGATVAHSVFSIPRMLQDAPPTTHERDHRLRCMFNARHDPAFTDRFGVRLIEGYGLTEAGNAIFSRIAELPQPGSCGRVSDEWDVRLADPDGAEVPVGEVGEILIRPREPQRIMIGYLNRPEANAAATRDLWFHTGDLAACDEEGFYYFKGRLKDMIRRRGQNISAWEVEQILLEHPGVGDAAALAQVSEIGDDDLRAVVSPADGATLDLDDLVAHCHRRMPAFMVPRYVEVLDELPRTPSGRVEKYRLADQPLGVRHVDLGARPVRPVAPTGA